MRAGARHARLPIAAASVLAASAVAALPFVAPAQNRPLGQPIPNHLSQPPADAAKGDRLRTIFVACDQIGGPATCADIFGDSDGPPATIVVERRIGEATSVLVRFQAASAGVP